MCIRDRITIGSGIDQDLQLTDQYVSRNHCVIRVGEDGLVCEDLDSTNGTLVGEHRVKGAVIAPGDMITVGETVLEVELPGDSITEPLSRDDHYGKVLGRSIPMLSLIHISEPTRL